MYKFFLTLNLNFRRPVEKYEDGVIKDGIFFVNFKDSKEFKKRIVKNRINHKNILIDLSKKDGSVIYYENPKTTLVDAKKLKFFIENHQIKIINNETYETTVIFQCSYVNVCKFGRSIDLI